MERIARVVERSSDATARKLRDGDRELCAVVAALTLRVFGEDWLTGILKSIQNRKKPADNPWGHFRGCCIKAGSRVGKDFHALEVSVVLPAVHRPKQEVSA